MDRIKSFLNSSPSQFRSPRPQTSSSPKVEPPSHINILPPPRPAYSASPPRILIIGAGSRGSTYGRSIMLSSNGFVVAIAEPVEFKRKDFGRNYIWGRENPKEGEEFEGWKEFMDWELQRREKQRRGEDVVKGVDGVIVCTLDEMHAEIITGLAPLNLHLLCEKPLATTLDDCLRIYKSLLPSSPEAPPTALFAIGHVLRYTPHNILLRKLLIEDELIGDIIAVEHTEPIGTTHFSHSYVRGNWRKVSTSGPSLLTKSCHDIDLLLWLLCSPDPGSQMPPHLPSSVTSTGSLVHFKRSRKPALAGASTNCLSCPAERQCQYSAKKIYYDGCLMSANTGWPLDVVVPDIEDALDQGLKHTQEIVLERLGEDYTSDTDQEAIDRRGWYGRCVYESDNDVCDDLFVTISWSDDFLPDQDSKEGQKRRGAKTASFHMTAFTEGRDRRTRLHGSRGEIVTDGRIITAHDFFSGSTSTHHPALSYGGHGGGDTGLTCQFVLAIDAVKNHNMSVAEAQRVHIGCSLEEAIRSHAFVFAAEEARSERKVVLWEEWWTKEVGGRLT